MPDIISCCLRRLLHFALDVVNWSQPQENVKASIDSHLFSDLQSCLVNDRVKVVFVDNVAEVNSGESFDGWFDPGEKRVFVFVESQNKSNSALLVLLENSFGHLEGFEIVWHQHERKAEEDKSIFKFEVFLDFVKVHIVNLDLLITVE